MISELKSKTVLFVIRLLHDDNDLELDDLNNITMLYLIDKEYELLKDLTIEQIIKEIHPLIAEIWNIHEEIKNDNNI